MRLTQIRIAGFGGQGVILAATVIGRGATIHENRFATMTQNFGPESRGGACSAQLIVSDEPVLYPYVTRPDIMVILSQEAFVKFAHEIHPGTTLLVEEELVRIGSIPTGARVFGIPATRIAEEMGKKMVLNIIVVGFFGAITGLLSKESLAKAVAESVPPHFRELNLKAFEAGYEYGMKKASGEVIGEPEPALSELES